MSIVPGSVNLRNYRALVDIALADMKKGRIMERIWDKDHTVWKPDPTEIANRLGWLDSPKDMMGKLGEIDSLVQAVRADGYTHALLLGMGGSSLAPEVFRKTFGVREGYLDLEVLDSTDPGAVLAYAERFDVNKTLFIVSTKSGGTVETFSFMKYFYNIVTETLGPERAGRHFIAITDPGSKLADLAEMYRFRKAFLNDPDIGGRYSALSYFGMVPAALIGMDIRTFLDRAINVMDRESAGIMSDSEALSGSLLGSALAELARIGRDKATFVFSSGIAGFGDWVEQLVAESTGKEGRGIMPVVGEPLGKVDVYGDDRVFVFLCLDNDKTLDEGFLLLEQAGHPVLRLQLRDPYDLGGQCFLWEIATAIAGYRLGINPFDQPDVEAAKVMARKVLVQYMERGEIPVEIPALCGDNMTVYGDIQAGSPPEALMNFLLRAKPRSYAALHAYIQPTAGTDAALLLLRTRLRDRFHLATTVGYGPRFLHSTGQLHKGDAGEGLFIQFTADDLWDTPIPDEMGLPDSSITFGVLKNAQASGDRQALINAGRSVIRFHLGGDIIGGLKLLTGDSLCFLLDK
jgi:transaldolase/glucose-6-phosphate isomerase